MKKSNNEIHICIVSPGYPNHGNAFFVFVEKLVNQFVEIGCKCTVIAPQSISKALVRDKKSGPKYYIKENKIGNDVEIYQPYFLTFSNFKMLNAVARWSHKSAVKRAYSKLIEIPDLFYAHFWESGIQIYGIAREMQIPLFVATGECEIPRFEFMSKASLERFSNYVSGVIAVSSKNKNESIKLGLTTEENCVVFNNSVNPQKFFVKDKLSCREALGYSQEDFIVVFVGYFIERKGIKRVSRAIEILDDKNIKSLFIGGGNQTPTCDGILHCGSVQNEKMVDYLNCADVFVLPTLQEGCCNAIIEAMACGLPIISSDLEFNDDILNDLNSIRIDPNNIEQLAESIKFLKENPKKRAIMSSESLKIAASLDLKGRAEKIIDYMQSSIERN